MKGPRKGRTQGGVMVASHCSKHQWLILQMNMWPRCHMETNFTFPQGSKRSLGKPAMKRSVIPKALKKKLPLRIWISIAIRHITGPKDFSLFLPIRCRTYLFLLNSATCSRSIHHAVFQHSCLWYFTTNPQEKLVLLFLCWPEAELRAGASSKNYNVYSRSKLPFVFVYIQHMLNPFVDFFMYLLLYILKGNTSLSL